MRAFFSETFAVKKRCEPSRNSRRGGLLLGAAVATGLGGGCLMTKVVTAPVKLATTTVVVAGETAGAVVKTTGKVAVGAVRATGSVADGGITAAAKLARAGTVTFVDVATGAVTRVPVAARAHIGGWCASGPGAGRDAGGPGDTGGAAGVCVGTGERAVAPGLGRRGAGGRRRLIGRTPACHAGMIPFCSRAWN